MEALAIGFLHSYANDAHERAAGAWLQQRLPQLSITLSSAVCPEIREYERLPTACANAYVQPLMASYLARLDTQLAAQGFTGALMLMTSGGGLTTLQTARAYPVRLVESGPAGGAILAAGLARALDLPQVLSFDMGGTTAEICLIADGQPEHSRSFEVARVWRNLKGSGLPVRIPVTEMVEIGAGGGSMARVDAMRRIQVGPTSAGSEPGPACYGRGGTQPTVTDANVVLGRISPLGFAAGSVALDRSAAESAVSSGVGTPAGLDLQWAAAGIGEIVEENMAAAARVHAIERGRTVQACTMIAFGGAAPLHAARLAQRLGMTRVVVPMDASVGSALGFLAAPVAFEVVRSHFVDETAFDAVAAARVDALLAAMADEATAIVRPGALGAALATRRSVEMRYRGQGHEIAIALPDGPLDAAALRVLRATYEARYEAQFGQRMGDVPLELLTWQVQVGTADAAEARAAAAAPRPASAATGRRAVFDPTEGRLLDVPTYDRPGLQPGMALDGPALVVEPQTTTWVPGGWRCSVVAGGHLLLQATA